MLFEAIKLLVLLGQVDFTLWAFQAQEASVHGSYYIDLEGPHANPIVCVLGMTSPDTPKTAVLDWCMAAVLHGMGNGSKSPGYDKTKQLIEEGYAVKRAVARTSTPQIPLRVHVTSTGDDQLEQLVKVASLQRRRDESSQKDAQQQGSDPRFSLSQVSSLFLSVTSTKRLANLSHITTAGVNIEGVCLSGMILDPDSADKIIRDIQSVTSSATRAKEVANRGCIREVVLSRKVAPPVATALLSALRVSRGVKTLSVNDDWQTPREGPEMSRSERDHLWKWIAFSIFSSQAAHQIERVRLDVKALSSRDVQIFSNTLKEQDNLVLEGPRGQKIQILPQRQITASRFRLSSPSTSTEDWIELPLQQVLVGVSNDVSDDDVCKTWVRVLLPGYGHAWVHDDDIQAADMVSDLPETQQSSVAAITLSSPTNASLDPTLQLLRSVGQQLKQLHIVNIKCTMPLDAWIADVVAACPRLEDLIVRGGLHVRSLDLFTQLYERGSLHAKSLGVAEVAVDDTASIPRLLNKLQESSHPTTRSLEKVAICARDLPGRIPRLLTVLDKLLSVNWRLKDVTVQAVYRPGVVPEIDDNVRRLHEKHIGKPVTLRRRAMESRSKMAFLSLFSTKKASQRRGKRHAQVARVMQKLDRAAISLVLEFAAVCEERKLLFRLSEAREDGDDEYEDEDDDDDEEEEWETEDDDE